MAKKAQKTKKVKTGGGWFAIVSVISVVLALNVACGAMRESINNYLIGYHVEGVGSSSEDRQQGANLVRQIEGEGIVMTQNDDQALPLDKDAENKVNVFGWAATDWVLGGSGSGQVKPQYATDFLAALTERGIEYNTELTTMYEGFRSRREFSRNGGPTSDSDPSNTHGALHSYNYEFSRLYEPEIDNTDYYTAAMLDDAQSFSDTAIVVIGRVSGESNDAPRVQYKRTERSTGDNTGERPAGIVIDETREYLEISTEEEALLEYVGSTYDKVIVLINAVNTMELGFMETIGGLDACLIVGGTGTNGTQAVVDVLYGNTTPSGRTADTYAYELSTAPSYMTTGYGNDTTNIYVGSNRMYPVGVTYVNGSSSSAYSYTGASYVDYKEGIYVGYRWYETADAMGYWSSEDAKSAWGVSGYDEVVQYPFGYGMSYAEFEWTVNKVTPNRGGMLTKDGKIELEVAVTNVSERYKGQDVVQAYYTAPYTNDGIEKAYVNLCAFAKTSVLEPGETEILTLSFDVEEMASYDCYDANNNGFAGYEVEGGAYTIKLMNNSHDMGPAVNQSTLNIEYSVPDEGFTYDVDSVTGEKVENRFTGTETTDGVAIDGNSDGSAEIVYMARNDFEGTFPHTKDENRAMTQEIIDRNLYSSAEAQAWNAANANREPVAFGVSGDLRLMENGELTELGIELAQDYEDPRWDSLLSQVSRTNAVNLILQGYTRTNALNEIGKPITKDLDGTAQAGSFASEGTIAGLNKAIGFPCNTVIAQTWNTQMAYSFGLGIGAEAISYGINALYAPAINMHRSPTQGRNFEYFSEDPYLTGKMVANELRGMKNTGVFSYLKHLLLNEMESGRDGNYVWLTEQTLREIYLKPFKMAIQEGGCTGIMTAYGRIGAVWTGGSYALLTEVVRNEYGFKGAYITDYTDHEEFMNGDQMLRAGGDLWMSGWQNDGSFNYDSASNNGINQEIRRATKNIVYMWLETQYTASIYDPATDNITINKGTLVPNFPWWIPALAAVDVVTLLVCCSWGAKLKRIKKEAESKKNVRKTRR